MELDLASLSSTRDFATEVLKNVREIHVLMNNAGVYVPLQDKDKNVTKEEYEIHFGLNHLGHLLLTNLLLNRVNESAPSR